MRFAFTEQQLELRAAVRQVLARECTPDDLRAIASPPPPGPDPEAAALAADGGHARGTQETRGPDGGGARAGRTAGADAPGRSATRWAVLSELGVPGLLVDEAHGGLGLSLVEMVGVLEEAGWAGVPEPLAETAALAAPLLAEAAGLAVAGSATAAAAERALPGLAEGALVATVGGVDVGAPGVAELVGTTRPAATLAGGGAARAAAGAGPAAISGSQGDMATPRVAGAARAGLLLLAWEAPRMGWQVHAVDADAVSVLPTPSIDATRDLATVEWTPWPHTVIASGEHAAQLVEGLADRAAFASAAQLLGLTDRMITLAADYARERRQFGKPIGSFQAVKHHLANARVRLEYARPATYRAADSLARRLPERAEHVSMAKALASDAADLAARVALQVHGAIGYTWECDLHLYMKRAWALSAAWGDAAAHRARVLSAAIARHDEPSAGAGPASS